MCYQYTIYYIKCILELQQLCLNISGLAYGSPSNQENGKSFGYDSGELGKNI